VPLDVGLVKFYDNVSTFEKYADFARVFVVVV
jgi:hypothetical protein